MKLASLRKRDKEADDEFMARFNLSVVDLQKWKRITDDGKIYGGPALERMS